MPRIIGSTVVLILLGACGADTVRSAAPTAPAVPTAPSGVVAPALSAAVAPPPNGGRAVVTAVIDGDTIEVEFGGSDQTVRLLGIDTPEKAGGPRPGECFGAEASKHARELLPIGSEVILSRDHETRDQYGRLLAYVHRTDGLFVNLAMLDGGYATPLFFAPNTTLEATFNAAADRARRDWLGFWPACGRADLVLGDTDAG